MAQLAYLGSSKHDWQDKGLFVHLTSPESAVIIQVDVLILVLPLPHNDTLCGKIKLKKHNDYLVFL